MFASEWVSGREGRRGTPGYHDNPSWQVGGVREAGWLLLGGLLRVQLWHALSSSPPPPPPVASGGHDMGRGSWEGGRMDATDTKKVAAHHQ